MRIDNSISFYSQRFGVCLPFVLEQEGVDSDDKHDPGGKTRYGIIQVEYTAYRKSKELPNQSVFSASDAEIQEIYWTHYWLPYCPKLWPGLDLLYFDQCVNEGSVQATKDLQRALNVTADGHFGPVTLGAVIVTKNRAALITRYTDLRLGFYRHLRNFPYFGKGWTRRADAAEQLALSMTPSSVA